MSTRIDALRNFIVLADERGMGRAANKLHMAQPTLSRQMIALEKEFDQQLYTREGGEIRLTPEGHTLYDYAVSIVELEERAKNELGKRIGGSVHVGYGETSALQLLASAMRKTQAQHEDIKFHITSGDTKELIELLDRGSIDFMLECDLRPHKRYESLVLEGVDTWAAVVPKNHPLSGKDRIGPTDLEGENLIVSRQAYAAAIRGWLGESQESIDVAVTFNLGLSIIQFAKAGLGIAVGYKEILDPYCEDFARCIPLDPLITSIHGIVWKKGKALSPAAKATLDALGEYAAGERE